MEPSGVLMFLSSHPHITLYGIVAGLPYLSFVSQKEIFLILA